MPKDFTNSKTDAFPVVHQGSQTPKPVRRGYIADGSRAEGRVVMPLTEKEKLVRQKQSSRSFTNRTGLDGALSTDTVLSGSDAFYSTQLSTDFLEKPQSLREKRELYRTFYLGDPIVGQALDLHTELPLSKVRLAAPKPRTCPARFKDPHDYGRYIHSFFKKMCDRIKLFQRLVTLVHHYWLDGCCPFFAEDSEVVVPPEVGYEKRLVTQSVLKESGDVSEESNEELVEREDREEEELKYYQKHYQGWSRLVIFPIDQVQVTGFNYTDKVRVNLIPSDRDRSLIAQAKQGDPIAEEMVSEIPVEVREYMEQGQLIPLGTDPDEGSFVYIFSGRKEAGETLGQSLLDRCLNVLIYRDKLRQAQTQIADRSMTPKRIVWGEDISDVDAERLREQVDLALVDPDYSIVANYEVHWEEMGSRDRLLDLSSEYEQTERQLLSGLGVTESLMTGESLYSGDRLKLEVINTRYLFLREFLQEFVEEYLFKPVARRKGFVELDEWGEEVVLYPKLSFTRLPLRDSQDTFDALLGLYQKGSIDISVILELFNLDVDEVRSRLENDMFTVNDSTFNEALRGAYSSAGGALADKTDLIEKLAKYLKLKVKETSSEEGRF